MAANSTHRVWDPELARYALVQRMRTANDAFRTDLKRKAQELRAALAERGADDPRTAGLADSLERIADDQESEFPGDGLGW